MSIWSKGRDEGGEGERVCGLGYLSDREGSVLGYVYFILR